MAQTISHGYGSDLTSDSFNLKFKDLSGSNKILSGFRVVPGTTGLRLSVNHGSATVSLAYVSGVRVEETIPLNDVLTLSAAHATYNRYDVIALRYVWGATGAVATYQILVGSPQASPVVPNLPDGTFLKLADVLVRAASTTVVSGDIVQADELKSAASWGGRTYYVQATQPSSGNSGDQWHDISVIPNIWKFYDGSSWTPGSFSNLAGTISDTQHGQRGGGALHQAATPTVPGFMSAADKVKTDNSIQKDGSVAMTGLLTLSGDPTQNLHSAPRQYVENSLNIRDSKLSARAATTANIALSTLQTIDGVTLVAGDRVLVKNQVTASQNGIYVVATGAWTRASDADTSAKVTYGIHMFVSEGTVNADSGWLLSTNNPVTLGTTNLAFVQFTGAGQLVYSNGIVITGNEIAIADGGVFDNKLGTRTIIDTNTPTSDTDTLSKLLGFLANMIKGITGKANWRTAPATTLESANTHINAINNPHVVTAAQVGASPLGHVHDYAAITGKPTSFTPGGHAASHWVSGSDALAPQDIGAESINGATGKMDIAKEASLVVESVVAVTGAEATNVQTTMGPAVEFANASTQSVTWNRVFPFAANACKVELRYAADVANAGNFRVRVAYRVNGGVVTNVDITVTPGNDAILHTADLGIIVPDASVNADDLITFTLSRLGADAADTHTGKLRIYQTRMMRG